MELINEINNVEINITITGPFDVVETKEGKTFLTGTFLKLDSVTGNGRVYRFEEGKRIAGDIIGNPVYHGIDEVNKHLRGKLYEVGKVVKAWVVKAKKIIRGVIEVWNTKTYPNITETVKKNWGFSVGGQVDALQLIMKGGRLIMKCFGMAVNHLQLIKPNVERGQREARVEGKQQVEETIAFDPCPWGICPTKPVPEKIIRRRIEEHHIFFDEP